MPESSVEVVKPNSMKREVAATVIATGVGIALSIGANVLIGKLTVKVHNQIAPSESTEEN